jgi:hypothetical protein
MSKKSRRTRGIAGPPGPSVDTGGSDPSTDEADRLDGIDRIEAPVRDEPGRRDSEESTAATGSDGIESVREAALDDWIDPGPSSADEEGASRPQPSSSAG